MSAACIIRILRTLALAGATAAVAACGQSGPLYLPGNPSQVQAPVPEPARGTEDEDDEDEAERDR